MKNNKDIIRYGVVPNILFKCGICGELSLEKLNCNIHTKVKGEDEFFDRFFTKQACSNCGIGNVSGYIVYDDESVYINDDDILKIFNGYDFEITKGLNRVSFIQTYDKERVGTINLTLNNGFFNFHDGSFEITKRMITKIFNYTQYEFTTNSKLKLFDFELVDDEIRVKLKYTTDLYVIFINLTFKYDHDTCTIKLIDNSLNNLDL